MTAIAEILGPDGALAHHLPGFRSRPQQLAMAEAVAETLEQGGILIGEAGTGTGKTFAYLVPALLSGLKVIVSTGTRNLQDQLYHRDLPLIREALGNASQVALLKGRSNYLCRERLSAAVGGVRHRPEIRELLWRVRQWAAQTRSGDIAECAGVAEDAPVWPLATSTVENCLGSECDSYAVCHLVEARRRAQEADLVVINHHLLCADMALREDGFGELLPAADLYIVDEAHNLPEVASDFFGTTLTGRQLLDLARDSETEYFRDAGDLPELTEQSAALKKSIMDLRLALGERARRGGWQELDATAAVAPAFDELAARLAALAESLARLEGRGKGLDQCRERCGLLGQRLDALRVDDGAGVRWFETSASGFRLNRTPLEIAGQFKTQLELRPAAWVFTSATLAVGGRFDHFSHRLGIEEARTHCWDSPFDYPHQALWFVPRGLPDPNGAGYNEAVAELTLKLLELSRGRAFLLYTSHRALRAAADFFAVRIDYPLLVQGDAPRGELLERFRELGNAVLLGTSSFWEGVDVRGEALSLVVIDRLPFASPSDPVLQARIDALRRRGGNPFFEYQLPQATIALKQGAGRLIRDASDRGVLVVCDPRLLRRGYGQLFLDSLPPFARTRDLAAVEAFFARMPA